MGVEDLIVVATADAVLVAKRHKDQEVAPLNLIEVQSGPYLGEDDIVRFEDAYARS